VAQSILGRFRRSFFSSSASGRNDSPRRQKLCFEELESKRLLAVLPNGFTETRVASLLTSPTSLAISDDGRVFVAEENGTIRVIKNDTLLATPFATLTTDSRGERGLLGITLDPNFDNNHYVYVFYTATTPSSHTRVSRLTANGDTMLAGSEQPLVDLGPIPTDAIWRMGGALHFGPDGDLYISVGDEQNYANSQSLSNPYGKILRIKPDGTIPTDNPFYDSTSGINQAIWAYGLRNPFTTAFQPGSGRFFIDDVGQASWEEIDEGAAGANYGWSTTEGMFNQSQYPNFTEPLYAYSHSHGTAITGGAFYNPQTAQFPSQYTGDYFFNDFGTGEIRIFDPNSDSASVFATGANFPTNLAVSNDGSLYYLSRGIGTGVPANGTGQVYKVQYSPTVSTPGITYLSDLPTATAPINGWGPMERDQSNGEQKAGDGHTITLNGVSYAKGLGVHAVSDVTFNLAGQYTQFLSDIGVDDEVGSKGSVDFQVWGDGVELFDSGTMTGDSPTQSVTLDVSRVQQLKLVVKPTGIGISYDHADWAMARLSSISGGGSQSPPPPAVQLAPAVSYPTGANAHGVVTADINGDGKPDLIVANSGSNTISVLMGNGNGTFSSPLNYAVGKAPKAVAAADLNGDGAIDLVTANQDSGTISVLLNRGDGTFAPAVSYTATAGAHDVALDDVNGDGVPDIAEVGWGANVVRVLINNGDGTFSSGINYNVGKSPHSVAFFDPNGSRLPSLAVADHDSNNVAVLLNNGDGTFKAPVYYAVGSKPHMIRAADLNGDGNLDLVTANEGSNTVSILLGNGDGTFAKAVSYGTGPVPKGVAIGDLNGDGLPDIVTANTAGNYPKGNNPGGNTISVLVNLGDGKFAKPVTFVTGVTPFDIALADFNNDGKLDVATANWSSDDLTVLLGT